MTAVLYRGAGTGRRVTVRQGPKRKPLTVAEQLARVLSGQYRGALLPEHRDDYGTHTRVPACLRADDGRCRGRARIYRLPDAGRARTHACARVSLCDVHAVRPY